MRVTIGIPSQWGLWRSEMGLSLIRALQPLGGEVHLSPQGGPYLDMNREACAREAVAMKSDFLIFVDTDMAFGPDALARLVAHGKDIVGANYYEKRFPLVSTVKLLDDEGQLRDDGKAVTQDFGHAPFQCGGVGAGLMAIRVSRMVECMAAPYFWFADQKGHRMGEELSFCTRARAAGLEVWCDPTIPVLHIGEFGYGKLD